MQLPHFFYGTAWKEDDTQHLVAQALASGFRAIDTANQRRHYHEAAVGAGIAESGVARDDLFLQTKFTHRGGQDHRLPYDADADVATQVEQSFASSLEHLRTDHIDSLVLHGPSSSSTLTDADWQAWRAMERIAKSGRARLLGVSNVNRRQLEQLLAKAEVPPLVVQNRCHARLRWDGDVRALCAERGLLYQPFSLLTANPEVLRDPILLAVAKRLGATPAQVVFRFALGLGMLPLTGTTSAEHMRQDLASVALPLEPADIARIERLSA